MNGNIDRAAKLIEDEESTNKRCVKGLSPNWKSRYQLSKKAETEVKAIIELGEEVKKSDTVSVSFRRRYRLSLAMVTRPSNQDFLLCSL